ncbi:MAG TPA: PAS domain-containing sensor histidine kinase [Myxococcaceae bacterium]|nr:PAS domain-containing sensor histidine kinase [Myxococcaceae bacterium]
MDAAKQVVARDEAMGGPQPPNPMELHYQLVVQGMEEGVVFHDQEGVIRATNPSAERILHVPADALLGRRSVLERCDPLQEDGSPFSLERCPALVCLRTGQSERGRIIGIRQAGGELSWLSFTSHLLMRADGGRAGVVTSFRDITVLRDRETQSKLRYEEASHTVRLHDAFLATAAHELRTPLTALRLQVQNLLHRVNTGAGLAVEVLTTKLQAAVRQTERLNALIDLLLDVSRMTVGRIELKRTSVDLAELARDLLARHADELTAGGIEVRLEAKPVTGDWDVARLEQVVGNLLSNALKYGNRKPVHIEVRREGASALLAVTDTGLGVPASDHRRIFERFERAHSGTQTGLGLGLWVVREIVAAHGGSIELASVPNEGSTFTVRLPLAPTLEAVVPEEGP